MYYLDDQRVVRVLHEDQDGTQIRRNQDLINELTVPGSTISMPRVIEVTTWEGRTYSVEHRFPGRSMLAALHQVDGIQRERMIESHLETAASLGRLNLHHRDYFGDLVAPEPVREPTWRRYLQRKAEIGLSAGAISDPPEPALLADALPDPEVVGFVHLDAFAGNMMTDGRRITAVLDLGPACVRGDIRLNALAAVVYLEASEITPGATPKDRRLALEWLASQGLDHLLEPARAWLAAYWSFATDDSNLMAWVHSVLDR